MGLNLQVDPRRPMAGALGSTGDEFKTGAVTRVYISAL